MARSEYLKQWCSANKKRVNFLNQRRRERQRNKLLEIVGNTCKDCGNTDTRVLQFDHVSDNKICNVGRCKSWKTALEEAQKCEVVCANCHAIRTYERRPKQERGETVWLKFSKTHCPKGHLMNEENTRYCIRKTGKKSRVCITCHRISGRLSSKKRTEKRKLNKSKKNDNCF
jgi:hypothetical protein